MKLKRSKIVLIFVGLIGLILGIYYIDSSIYQNTPVPTDLHPIVKENSEALIQRADELGIKVIITDGFRSFAEQNSLYAKGRTSEGSIVTYVRGGESYHNFGLAVDFALRNEAGEIIWDLKYDGNGNAQSDWLEVVAIAKELGFRWGGDWKSFKDYPHLEMNFGLSIRELQKGKRPESAEL